MIAIMSDITCLINRPRFGLHRGTKRGLSFITTITALFLFFLAGNAFASSKVTNLCFSASGTLSWDSYEGVKAWRVTSTYYRRGDYTSTSANHFTLHASTTSSSYYSSADQVTVNVKALGDIDGNGDRPILATSDSVSWTKGTAAGSCAEESTPTATSTPAPTSTPTPDNDDNNDGGSGGSGPSGSSGPSGGSSSASANTRSDGGLRLGAIGVLYRINDGTQPAIHVYGIDENSRGHFMLRVSQSEIDAAAAGLVKSTEGGRVAVFVEENRDISLAIGPSPSGKVHYVSLQNDLKGPVVSTFDTLTDTPPGVVAPPTIELEPVASSFNIHIVQRGENLYQIALRYGVSVDQVVVDNRLAHGGQRLHSGQELQIHNATRNDPPRYIVPVLVQPANEDGSLLHTVEAGHTLSDIALAYGITVDDIVALNQLADGGRLIFPGQELVLAPVGTFSVDLVRGGEILFTSSAESSGAVSNIAVADTTEILSDPVIHVVRPGDRVYRIAQSYGVSVADIVALNQLSNDGRLIFPGQELVIIPAETRPVNLVRRGDTQSSFAERLDAVTDIVVAETTTAETQLATTTETQLASVVTRVVSPSKKLYRIAQRHGVAVDDVTALKQLADDGHLIFPEQEQVFVPAETFPVELVRSGDTQPSFAERLDAVTDIVVAEADTTTAETPASPVVQVVHAGEELSSSVEVPDVALADTSSETLAVAVSHATAM